jgi:alkyl sulfatase BDS1-like metallo-beta-lactamase superfamily hydrolase
MSTERKPASAATLAAHKATIQSLPADDGSEWEFANRGFIGTIPDATVGGAWSMAPYAFLQSERPDTVNPSLWRQARFNALHGLFEVTPGVYQVRGFDISNITFVEGERGYIVIDPLTSAEPAAAALALLRQHRGDRPVTAVIYTHSHVDHYGGVRGVLAEDDAVPIIAPEGFIEAAVSENVLLGNVMNRRATYMYGALLPRDAQGHVDSGLGKAVSFGQVSLVAPNLSIRETGEVHHIDGVEIRFQVTPDTEAPAEMNFFFPGFGALCMAENCTCHLHNLYTPRGAQVRDARGWSRYIDEARRLYAGDTDVLFASHHWPRWGAEEAERFLVIQRDLYKFIHDQTLRLANHGYGPLEIAERLALPPTLAAEWTTRGYYGTLNHNAKAVYQRYLGWFDGNPANLHRHPPEATGTRYVALAGGAEALLAAGARAYSDGDYRWTAELASHLVFADPDNAAGRELLADALEQLGYQAESGPWRDFYLTGAQEAREPKPPSPTPRLGAIAQLFSLGGDDLLSALSVRLNGEAAGGEAFRVVVAFIDSGESFEVSLENAVLHHGRTEAPADVSLTRETLVRLVLGQASLAEAGLDEASGLARLLPLLDRFDFWFNIVTP